MKIKDYVKVNYWVGNDNGYRREIVGLSCVDNLNYEVLDVVTDYDMDMENGVCNVILLVSDQDYTEIIRNL